MKSDTFKRLMIPVLFTAVMISCKSPGVAPKEPAKQIDVEASVPGAISDVAARDYALCQLHSAIWGGYDATVNIEAAYTTDKKPRRFEISAGRLLVTTPDHDVSTEASRSNLVKISDREDAFSKGIPFFIDDVRFAAPDSLSFRIWSNASAAIKTAAPRIQRVHRAESGYTSNIEVVDTHNRISSSAEPKTVTLKEDRLDGWVLSVVTMDTQNRCLASNEIDLAPLSLNSQKGPEQK